MLTDAIGRNGGRLASAALVFSLVFATLTATANSADGDKRLDRVKGVVGFSQTADAPLHQVVGKEILPDDYFAVTQARAAADLVLPDSSIVAFGENTRAQVGAFNQTATGPGSTITVQGGTLRFDIHRPAGGTANFHFATSTTQIAVRGTVGLLSFIGGNTTVACLVCAADSVSVTVGTQTIALLTGQVITISAAGVIVTSAITSTMLGAFTGAQVSTVAATGPAAATAGVTAATTGVAAGTIAGAAVGAAAVGVTASSIAGRPTPSPTQTPPTATNVTVLGKHHQ